MSGDKLSLPFLILNLGSEMLYILDQRLRAQNISVEKGLRVREDLLRQLFSSQFIEELLRPQAIYSLAAARQVFERLAQSSIMKLNDNSMSKLFDLMVMGLKMQLMLIHNHKTGKWNSKIIS